MRHSLPDPGLGNVSTGNGSVSGDSLTIVVVEAGEESVGIAGTDQLHASLFHFPCFKHKEAVYQ